MEEKNLPKKYSLVVCRIKNIDQHSATADVIEYNRLGLIPVSEVASRWVRNIREFLKEGEYVVCRVLDADEHHITLSVKRVYREDASRKLNEFKRENRAKKLLEMASKSLGRNLEQAEKEIGEKLRNEFGTLTKAFEVALKNEDLLHRKGVPEKWVKAIAETARKNYAEKTFRVRGNLKLVSYKPDGIELIKNILLKVKKQGLSVHYISAPSYVIYTEGKSYREVENRVMEVGEQIVKEFQKHGEASFELEK